jgi:hypothetical protein
VEFVHDPEAVYQDADIAQAGYVAEANRLAALRESGVCLHSSGVGVSESGEVFYPEQEGLTGEQIACTEHTNGCQVVFENRDAWDAARMSR